MKAKTITFCSYQEVDTEIFLKVVNFICALAEKVDQLVDPGNRQIQWNVLLGKTAKDEKQKYFAAHIHVVGSAMSPGHYVSGDSRAISLGQVDIRFDPDTGKTWAGASCSEEIAALLNKLICPIENTIRYNTSEPIPALLGGSVQLTSGTGLVRSQGKWYRIGHAAEPKSSMIEAMEEAMLGGITIHDMTYIFAQYGTTLGQCHDENPSATMSFLRKKLKYLNENHGELSGTSCHQYRDDLVGIIEKQTRPDQADLRDKLTEMARVCEEEMRSAGIPLESSFYNTNQ